MLKDDGGDACGRNVGVGRRKNRVGDCGNEGGKIKPRATALVGLGVESASWRKAQPTSRCQLREGVGERERECQWQ